MDRVVGVKVDILPISKGDTITVRRSLNTGEQRAYLRRGRVERADGTTALDPLDLGVSLVLAFLLDWTLKYADGSPIVIREPNGQPKPLAEVAAALDSLFPDTFGEIKEAIEIHSKAKDAERALEKNGPGGEMTSSAISPSQSDAAGASSGSESSTPTSTTL
jgi:hypothetical protein